MFGLNEYLTVLIIPGSFNALVIELLNSLWNPDFLIEMQILACEYDFTQYIDTKKIIFLKLIKIYLLV